MIKENYRVELITEKKKKNKASTKTELKIEKQSLEQNNETR